jgi:transposase
MKRFVEGEDRSRSTFFPKRLDDDIVPDNPVRVIDAFVDELDLKQLDFEGTASAAAGRPAYHLATRLTIYLNGATSAAFRPVAAWNLRHSAMPS